MEPMSALDWIACVWFACGVEGAVSPAGGVPMTDVDGELAAELAEVRAVISDAADAGHPDLLALVSREGEILTSLAIEAVRRIAPRACEDTPLEVTKIVMRLSKTWQAIRAVDIKVSRTGVTMTATRAAMVDDFDVHSFLSVGDRLVVTLEDAR